MFSWVSFHRIFYGPLYKCYTKCYTNERISPMHLLTQTELSVLYSEALPSQNEDLPVFKCFCAFLPCCLVFSEPCFPSWRPNFNSAYISLNFSTIFPENTVLVKQQKKISIKCGPDSGLKRDFMQDNYFWKNFCSFYKSSSMEFGKNSLAHLVLIMQYHFFSHL